MNILALDLGKQAGHAFYSLGGIQSGTNSFAPLPGQPIGALFDKWDSWIEWQLKNRNIDLIGYELIEWNMVSPDWRQIYLGMKAIILGHAYNLGIDARGYPVQDIKIAATGKAKATKANMISSARAQWPDQDIIDDNQADALWVLYLACQTKGIQQKKHSGELDLI